MDPLADYIEHCQRQVFCWQEWNCVHFVQAWVFRYEGLFCKFPQSFTAQGVNTQLSAFRYSRKLGGLSNVVTAALGREAVSAAFAAYGDVVFVGTNQSSGTLGICNGRNAFVLSPTRGIALLETEMFELAWKLKRA